MEGRARVEPPLASGLIFGQSIRSDLRMDLGHSAGSDPLNSCTPVRSLIEENGRNDIGVHACSCTSRASFTSVKACIMYVVHKNDRIINWK